MTKEEFIKNYIMTFCATWAAQNHQDYCARDLHDALENPPIEDAEFLAEGLWERMQK